MALHLKEIIEKDPDFNPLESFRFIRKIKRETGDFGLLCGNIDSVTNKRPTIWLGRMVLEAEHLFYLPEIGVYEFTLNNGFKARPDYAYGLHRPESYRLQYGNLWAYQDLLSKTGFDSVINGIDPELSDTLNALLLYNLTEQGAAHYKAAAWLDGCYAKLCYPRAAISSGSISKFLRDIGREANYRQFFKLYLDFLSYSDKVSHLKEFPILIDSTGLPNDIKMYPTAVSNHNGDINNEVRVIYVTDRDTGLPIYFKYVSGNIIDISTLQYVITTLSMCNIDVKSIIMDAGYNSKDNLLFLNSLDISFITRMQENRSEFKEIMQKHWFDLIDPDYIIEYLDKSIFCKKVPINIDNNIFYAYLCCDGDRFSSELKTYTSHFVKNRKLYDPQKNKFQSIARFILISNTNYDTSVILENYYKRQQIEQNFDISKNYASMVPIRVHSEEAFRGHLLLSFIRSIIIILLSKSLKNNKIDPLYVFDVMKNVDIDMYNIKDKDKVLPPLRKYEKAIIAALQLEKKFDIASGDFKDPFLKQASQEKTPGRRKGSKNRARHLYSIEHQSTVDSDQLKNACDNEHGDDTSSSTSTGRQPRGRPKGPKNKPKGNLNQPDTSSSDSTGRLKDRPRG
jgi:hypothetical protein